MGRLFWTVSLLTYLCQELIFKMQYWFQNLPALPPVEQILNVTSDIVHVKHMCSFVSLGLVRWDFSSFGWWAVELASKIALGHNIAYQTHWWWSITQTLGICDLIYLLTTLLVWHRPFLVFHKHTQKDKTLGHPLVSHCKDTTPQLRPCYCEARSYLTTKWVSPRFPILSMKTVLCNQACNTRSSSNPQR